MEGGHADTLVISHFADDIGIGIGDSGESMQRISVTDYCEEHWDEGVICFTPSEDATIGEAFAVREIVARESWEEITVVTSLAHAFWALYIFERWQRY